MTDQQTLFDKNFKPRPIALRSPDARRLKVGKLQATQRSLNFLRKQGWTVDVTEHFVTHGGTKAQQAYIEELVRQRANLIDTLRAMLCVEMTKQRAARIDYFLAELREPKPPAGIGGYRKDLFGFMDILAFHGKATLAVQTTSFQQVATHLREFRRDEKVRGTILEWITDEHRALVIHGWRCMEVAKKSGKGTKAEWQVTERLVKAADLSEKR